jgi:hypothetical protein
MRNCPGCDVSPGNNHIPGCDIETCPECGMQSIGCDCEKRTGNIPWEGDGHNKITCRKLGWYATYIPNTGWKPCNSYSHGATEDLNRLYSEAVWDKETLQFVLK